MSCPVHSSHLWSRFCPVNLINIIMMLYWKTCVSFLHSTPISVLSFAFDIARHSSLLLTYVINARIILLFYVFSACFWVYGVEVFDGKIGCENKKNIESFLYVVFSELKVGRLLLVLIFTYFCGYKNFY